MSILRHIDFEVPGFGELASPPPIVPSITLRPDPFRPPGYRAFNLRSVPVASSAVNLVQEPLGAFPDRGTVSMAAGLIAGTDDGTVEHDLGSEHPLLHTRFLFDATDAFGGGAVLLQGLDSSVTETFNVHLDADTRTVKLTLATSETISVVTSEVTWHCVEVQINAAGGTAELWVDGVSAGSVSGTFTTLATQTIRLGVMNKDASLVGTLSLDEWVMATAYIGPVVIQPTSATAQDPTRWLVLYDADYSGSSYWANSYKTARNVPYANLLGITGTASFTVIDSAAYNSIKSQINNYITTNGLTGQICGILIGHAVAGIVDIGGTDYSMTSLLADLDDDTPDKANPKHLAGVADTGDLPDRSTLVSGSSYLTSEVSATLLTTAQALTSRTDALISATCDGQELSTLDPATDLIAADAAAWTDLDNWLGSVSQQQVRLPLDLSFDGSAHGHAVNLTDDVAGPFSVTGQNQAMFVTIGADADMPVVAVDSGYAFAVGQVAVPAASSLINPASLLAALRAGWTWAEAIALAAPTLNSTWRAIGDPLGRMLQPLQGYDVYQRHTRDSTDTLIAVSPTGVAQATLVGYTAGSEQYIHVKAVSRCGMDDAEPTRLQRVAFDDLGGLILPVPNAPVGLQLHRYANGGVKAVWSYISNGQRVAPNQFNVYLTTGSAAFDFGSVTQVVAYFNRLTFTADLGTFTDGTLVRVVVRAESTSGGEEQNLIEVNTRADAVAPDDPTSLSVEVFAE